MTERKFQPRIVGKTNVVEGAVIPWYGEQLVNYLMLYNQGDECADVTGGFAMSSSKFTSYGADSDSVSGYGSFVKNADNLSLQSSYTNMGTNNYKIGTMATANKVDLTDFSKIVVRSYTTHTSTSSYASNGSVRVIANESKTTGSKLLMTGLTSTPSKGKTVTKSGLFASDILGVTGVSTFATVDELIADTTAISAILSNASAVKFMVKRCTGDFMASFVASSACRSLLESSPYKTIVQSNEHWAKFLGMVA